MEMKNKILSWLVTIGLCIVLIPIGCILLILNILTYRKLRKLEKIVYNELEIKNGMTKERRA